MIKRDFVFGLVSLVGVTALVGTTTTVCAQDQQQQQKGQARVVERRGPEVDLKQSARAQVVVLFPGAIQQQSSGQGDVEIYLVESQYAQSADNQGQQGQAQSTGREILFTSRDAQNGVVSYSMDAAGNGRKIMLVARVNGEIVEVRQTGGGEGVTFYTVQRPQQGQSQMAQGSQPGGQTAQNSGGGSGTSQGGQQGGSGGGQPEQGGGSDPQAQGQMDQSQTLQLQQGAQQPEQAAIIVVYTAGGQQ